MRLLGERARGLLPFALQPLGKQRHEGRVESAFAEQAAEQVGKAERDVEGVRHPAGAEGPGEEDVAHESRDTRLTSVRPPTVAKEW